MSKKQEIIDEILLFLQDHQEVADKKSFHKAKNTILAKFKEKDGPTGIEMIARYQHFIKTGMMEDDIRIHKILRKRAIRSLSGVAVISLLTKFWGCPGKCVFCPTYE